jgi:outer membrane protein assembly factor BamB
MSYREIPPPHPVITVQSSQVCGFDPLSGRKLWEHTASTIVARFMLAHGRVYLVDQMCEFVCIDAATGTVIRQAQIGGSTWSASAIVAGPELVCVTTQHSLVALDRDGRIAWQVEIETSNVRGGLGLPGQVVQPDFGR